MKNNKLDSIATTSGSKSIEELNQLNLANAMKSAEYEAFKHQIMDKILAQIGIKKYRKILKQMEQETLMQLVIRYGDLRYEEGKEDEFDRATAYDYEPEYVECDCGTCTRNAGN
jgi:hypothetical protein